MNVRVTKRAYIPHEEILPFRYPDEMEKILEYLNERGTLQVTDKEVEALYFEFSDERYASWLDANTDNLEQFADWLARKEVVM